MGGIVRGMPKKIQTIIASYLQGWASWYDQWVGFRTEKPNAHSASFVVERSETQQSFWLKTETQPVKVGLQLLIPAKYQ